MSPIERIELKDSITALRKELIESILAAQGEALRFEVGEITLEFQVEVEKAREGKGGIRFWVVDMGAGGSLKDKAIHKVTIPLKPVTKGGGSVYTGGEQAPSSASDSGAPKSAS